ncbi:MAG: hypothetical protein HFH82_14780 [Lachnospiraceae bacterium]|nr:hypothetical protein [Lachnospiraceae bacterium]
MNCGTGMGLWQADGKINSFFENRLRTIKRRPDENSNFIYTETEKEMFMERAEELTKLRVGFAEGWKILNHDMGSFIPFSLLMIFIIIMPLFADDAQTKMKELCLSTKNGKKELDLTRIITAFGVGSVLYFVAVIFYFFAKMIPFGFSGGGEYIQSNEDTFFLYSISHMQGSLSGTAAVAIYSACFCYFHDNPEFGSDGEGYGRNCSSQLLWSG